MQHGSPVPLDAVTAPDNDLGPDGVEALRPALEKLTKLTHLDLGGTCGDVQWRWVVMSVRAGVCVCVRACVAGLAVVVRGDGLLTSEVRGVSSWRTSTDKCSGQAGLLGFRVRVLGFRV